jgi:hypothetical protein
MRGWRNGPGRERAAVVETGSGYQRALVIREREGEKTCFGDPGIKNFMFYQPVKLNHRNRKDFPPFLLAFFSSYGFIKW